MKMKLYSIIGGALVTFGLFFFMSVLIQGDGMAPKGSDDDMAIDFVRVKRDAQTQVKQRRLPKKLPEPPKPPKLDKIKVADLSSSSPTLKAMTHTSLRVPLSFGTGPFLGTAGGGGSNSEVTPLVRIEPTYPRKAAMQGIEGWVLLKFDINELGRVENVAVIKSQPHRVFDSSAKRALLKFKYRPKVSDGKPEAQSGNLIKLEFKLKG